MEKEMVLQILSIITSCMAFSVLFIFGLAIYFYPGGTYSDPNYVGFHFLETTISDLGRFIARNGEDNTISRALFMTGLMIMSLFCFYLYTVLVWLFKNRKSTKILSIIGTTLGYIQAGLYIALGFAPVDVNVKLHNRLIFSGAGFLVSVTIIYLIVFFMDREYPKIGTYSYLGLFISEFCLMIAVVIGSILKGPVNEHIRRSGHTLLIFIIVFVYGLQFIGLSLYFRSKRKEEAVQINGQE